MLCNNAAPRADIRVRIADDNVLRIVQHSGLSVGLPPRAEDVQAEDVNVRRDERICVQVRRSLSEGSDRGIGNLLEIKGNYPKYLDTLDELTVGYVEGTMIIYLSDF